MASITLLDLPNEVLCEVFGNLEYERPHLLALSRLSFRLHALVQPFLYRHPDNLSPHQKGLFRRSLEQSPKLGQAVRSYGTISVGLDPLCRADGADLMFLEGLQRLNKVKIRIMESSLSHAGAFPVSESRVLNQVEDVLLYTDEGQYVESALISIMQLQRIKTLSIRSSPGQVKNPYRPPLPGWITCKDTGNVTTLRLIGKQCLDLAYLGLILNTCHSLRNLECQNVQIKFAALPLTRLDDHGWLMGALKLRSSTLQSLRLTSNDSVMASPVDGNLLNFSSFPSLRELDLNAECLFSLKGRNSIWQKSNIFQRLPPKLENLTVRYVRFLFPFPILHSGDRNCDTLSLLPEPPPRTPRLYNIP